MKGSQWIVLWYYFCIAYRKSDVFGMFHANLRYHKYDVYAYEQRNTTDKKFFRSGVYVSLRKRILKMRRCAYRYHWYVNCSTK